MMMMMMMMMQTKTLAPVYVNHINHIIATYAYE